MYISVDVEASGCIPVEYSLLSIGACVIDNPKNSFYIELKPINDNFTASAIKVTGDLWKKCKIEGYEPKEAMKRFNNWLESLNDRVVALGFNYPFDHQFLNYYFVKFLGYSPLGINGLDLKAYAMGMFDIHWYETTKKRLKHKYPFLKTKHAHTHNALDDAIEQAELANILFKFNKKLRREIING